MEDLLKQILQEIRSIRHPPLVYTTEELANELHTHVHRINDLRRLGAINGIKKGTGWIYPAEEVRRFLKDYQGADLGTTKSIKAEVLKRRRVRSS